MIRQLAPGRIPPLLVQEGSEDGATVQPGHVPDARCGRAARARRPVLQAPRVTERSPGLLAEELSDLTAAATGAEGAMSQPSHCTR
jgi:hypothetical protein